MGSQVAKFVSMREGFDEEQRSFHEDKMASLEEYLGQADCETTYDSLKDVAIIETFMKALSDPDPKELYKVESWNYRLYYGLLRLPLPEAVRYWLFKRFLRFPHL